MTHPQEIKQALEMAMEVSGKAHIYFFFFFFSLGFSIFLLILPICSCILATSSTGCTGLSLIVLSDFRTDRSGTAAPSHSDVLFVFLNGVVCLVRL